MRARVLLYEQYLTINFPLYDRATDVKIGVEPKSKICKADKYVNERPIIYYGSSITRGGCASRPGTSYRLMISRRFNCDYRNLGWSGSAGGEAAMAEYIASQPMCLFFSDYDHNFGIDKGRHEPFILTIREKNPDLPIIIATQINVSRFKRESEIRDNNKKSYIKHLKI